GILKFSWAFRAEFQGLLVVWRLAPELHSISGMLTGKGCFIWQVGRCERGIPAAIADKAAAAGLSHVLLKVAEGTYAYGIALSGRDLVAPGAAALGQRALQVWGWHYVYGDKPGDEAQRAVQRVRELELD